MSIETAPEASTTNGAAQAQPKRLVLEAKTVEEARDEAAKQLEVPAEQLSLRVVSRQKKGLFGLGGEVLQVEATWRPPAPVIPGRIELSCEKGKVSMAVFRPEGSGKLADQSILETMLLDWPPLDARDEAIITQTLRQATGQPQIFATIAPSTLPADGDDPGAVKVSADDFTAWLIPWSKTPCEKGRLQKILEHGGVKSGIDEGTLDQLEGTVITKPVVVAWGRPAAEGMDASAEYVIEQLMADRGPAVREDGTVDYRDVGGAPTVQEGDVLVKKIESIEGEDGYTVRGKPLHAKKVKDFDLRRLMGQNVGLSEDKMSLVAKIGGLASRMDEKIVVMPVYSVPGDVDFKTGNVEFEGNLIIQGGVKPGFTLKATGNIQIGGTVEAGHIEAGGDVIVNGGVVGQNEGTIRAGGSITARFVEGAELHAMGPITVGSEIRHSTVISEALVRVVGAGRIVGGQVRGRDGVEANVLGSSSGAATTVQAGWGESLDVDVAPKNGKNAPIPKVSARNEAYPGVTITVRGGTQRLTRPAPGGVWRENEGKIQYSAS